VTLSRSKAASRCARPNRANGIAFLAFAPTFEHVAGQRAQPVDGGAALRSYDEKKARVPSWCDRVLWREWPGRKPAALVEYDATPDVCTSDHTPVHARLRVTLPPPIPRLPAEPEAREQFALVCTAIRATGLVKSDVGKHASADPYMRILIADGICSPACTAVQRRTLEPSWAQPLVVPLPWLYASADAVRAASALVSVMDKDTLTADDSLGHGVFAIGSEWPVRVNVALTRRGRVSGILSMAVHVHRRALGPLCGDWSAKGWPPRA